MSESDFTPVGRDGAGAPEEALLLEQLRRGDPDAGHRFVRTYYPGIYRYLLSLAGHREIAEDLTQQTFLQSWRHLDRFEPRGSLRHWLYRIAHRAFLTNLRSRRDHACLEEAAELAAPGAGTWTDTVELHTLISKLPVEEREVVLLHYLEGYTSAEIAAIVRAPAGTVRYRLSQARARLQRELGEGDLSYLNDPSMPGTRAAGGRQWAWLPLEEMSALEARLAMRGRGQRAEGGGQRDMLSQRSSGEEEPMERREFLRHAAAGAAGMMLPAEKEVVDDRLTGKVTVARKAIALSDLCDHLRTTTGIHLVAGNSIADEKVTVFCQQLPLRDVMRQLSRPFGYAWLRSGTPGEYRYELVQDLRSQLLEEELRNRDRNAALLALEKEIERFRPYLSLPPDEALARSKRAAPEERQLLERFSGPAWGAIQLYSRLTSRQMDALRAGKMLQFRNSPGPDQEPLPPDIARGVLESQRDSRIRKVGDRYDTWSAETDWAAIGAESYPLTALPELHGKVGLSLRQLELGQFALYATIGWQAIGPEGKSVSESSRGGTCVSGANPAVIEPDNVRATARFARAPALSARVTVRPRSSCHRAPDSDAPKPSARERKVTTADVLEALHQASGLPIVADYYTRLYPVTAVSTGSQLLYDALNHLATAMRLRWCLAGAGTREAGYPRSGWTWLQFRSAGYYNDRLKEVPSRLLTRWATARQKHGMLRLDDLVEIAQLPDSQLNGEEMAEGARECFGLLEWDLVRKENAREGLRFMADLTSSQQQEVMSPGGLPFVRMSLAQQQRFLAIALSTDRAGISAEALAAPLRSLEELAEAAFRVEYTQPGEFQWLPAASRGMGYPIVVPLEPGPEGRRALLPPARGRTPAEALAAARRIDPRRREGLTRIDPAHLANPELTVEPASPQETEVVPTRLDLWFVYFLGSRRPSLTRNPRNNFYQGARGRQ
jgi:RNA polymerase sigma-70 factor (ECF subfamily)